MSDLVKRDRSKDKLIALSSAEIQKRMFENAGITDAHRADALHKAFQSAVLDLTSEDGAARNSARRDIFRLCGVDRPVESVQSQQVIIPVPEWGRVSIESKGPQVIDVVESEMIDPLLSQGPIAQSISNVEPAQDQVGLLPSE